MAKCLYISNLLPVLEEALFPDLFSIFCWLELDVSLSKMFSVGSFWSRSDSNSSSSTPTYVIFFKLIPSLVSNTWSKFPKYALVWGADPPLSLLSFACLQVFFRFVILCLHCWIDFAGPALLWVWRCWYFRVSWWTLLDIVSWISGEWGTPWMFFMFVL